MNASNYPCKYALFFLLFLFATSSIAVAQEKKVGELQFEEIDLTKISTLNLKMIAKRAVFDKEYYTAQESLEELQERDKTNYAEELALADVYLAVRDYSNAFELLEVIYEENPEQIELLLKLAVTCKNLGMYQSAEKFLQRFETEAGRSTLLFKKNQRAWKKEMLGLKLIENSDTSRGKSNFQVEALSTTINYPHLDVNPVPLENGELLFTSIRTYKESYTDGDSLDARKRNLYKASLKEGVITVENFESTMFPEGIDVGNIAFSADSTFAAFSKCNNVYPPECKLYVSKKRSDYWSVALELGSEANILGFTSTQPTFGFNEKGETVLYFVSDKYGGQGGLDIWYSVYLPDKLRFSDARNIGKDVNTEFNETTPWYNVADSTLYFSSNGHPSIGGQDIFKAKGMVRNWENPVNLGNSINTGADENYFILDADGKSGYFTSNRPNETSLMSPTCCEDIYKFTIVKQDKLVLEIK